MTLALGRHLRLLVTVSLLPTPRRHPAEWVAVGLGDRDVARLDRSIVRDPDLARAEALAILYGPNRHR